MVFKKNIFVFTILMLCVMTFSGCTFQEFFTAKNDKETEAADQLARSFLKTLKSGDMEAIASISTKSLTSPDAIKMLKAMAGQLEKREIVSIETVKARIISQYFSKTTRTLMAYQLKLDKGWMKALVVLDSTKGNTDFKVSTLYTEPIDKPMSELYAFTMTGVPTVNYLFLALTICTPIFILYMVSVCFRMHAPFMQKFMWILFILVGVGTLNFDWSSGRMGFRLFSALFLGASAYKDTIYGPWVLTLSFPVGAIAFFVYLSRVMKAQRSENNQSGFELEG